MSIFRRLFFASFAFTLLTLHASPLAHSEVLWDNWYVENVNGVNTGYYHEKVEIEGERAKIQVNEWEKDGKNIKTKNLGATAKNTPLLEPLFYNFRSVENGIETSSDGTLLKDGKVFSVKINEGKEPSKTLRAEMLPKLILASFFPVWINKNYKRINGVQPIEFMTILEDHIKDEVPVRTGSAYEMRADDFANAHQARKLRIEYDHQIFIWWVSKKGDAIKIEIPVIHAVVMKTDKEKAEKSLQ